MAFGSTPVEVDNSMIEAIKGKMASSGVHVLEKRTELSSGQLAQIKGAPFAGLEAVFMREMSGHHRAMVLVRMLALRARAVLEINRLILL